MLRTALAFTFALGCAAALETPLILASGTKVTLVDPANGSITVYEPSSSKADRVGLGKPAANFVADLENHRHYYVAEREGVVFSALRVGTTNNQPHYYAMFTGGKWFPDEPTKREIRAGKAALQTRVLRAEVAYWKTNPAYDGVVRVAYLSSGRYLALAVPSLHTLMFYSLDSDAATLAGTRNWGPDLYITGFNTSPAPGDFLKALPTDKRREAEVALGIAEEPVKPGEAPPAPLGQGDEPPTPQSDAWIAAGPNDSVILVDVPNRRAMLYQYNGRDIVLNSVRDLALDLIVPGLIGGSWRSDPSGEKVLDQAIASRRQHIQALGLPAAKDELLAMAQQGGAGAKGKGSTFEAVMNNGLATLNFVDRRTLLVLDSKGGQTLSLAAARDTTYDLAVAQLDQTINDRLTARQNLGRITTGTAEERRVALLSLRRILGLDPNLHKDAEGKLKTAFRNDPKEMQDEYRALIDEAAKKADELAKQAAERKKMLEEQRKKKTP